MQKFWNVEILKGNIVSIGVDVIVNATNNSLLVGGGVCAIHLVGGMESL